MIDEINEQIQILDWADARKYVHKGDKELFTIIDDISPSREYKFIKIRYPYGSLIQDNDTLYVPDKPYSTSPLPYAQIPDKIKNELSYRNIPFGMITENTIEIFKEFSDKVFCVCLSDQDQGIEIGVFEFFGLTSCYTATAGARSVYMIPKISESRYHKKLTSQYGINCFQPKNIFKHWHIFKNLYSSGNLKTKWETEIIFLNKNWDKMINDKSIAWQQFKSYLHCKGFQHSGFGRKQLILNLVWETITSILMADQIKPDPYTIDTLKHLIYIYIGAIAGSRPSIDDTGGPFTEIQQIYINDYGLNQIPTIMRPYQFCLKQNIPVYYSMQNPTLLSTTPNLKKVDTIIQEINSLNTIKEFLLSKLKELEKIKIDNHSFSELLMKMDIKYFHSDLYSYGKTIRPTREITEHDKDFLFSPSQKKSLTFAENGSFIKGCIKLSKAIDINSNEFMDK